MGVGEPFPMFRLATLLARQLSAPLATRIKEYAKHNPRSGYYVCAAVARAFVWGEWRARLLALQLAAPRREPLRAPPPPLSRAQAIEVGGNLLGEIAIFVFGAAIIIFEVNRQANKAEFKVLEERSQWLAVLLSLEELSREVSLQQADIERLLAALHALHTSRSPQADTSQPAEPSAANLSPSSAPSPFNTSISSLPVLSVPTDLGVPKIPPSIKESPAPEETSARNTSSIPNFSFSSNEPSFID